MTLFLPFCRLIPFSIQSSIVFSGNRVNGAAFVDSQQHDSRSTMRTIDTCRCSVAKLSSELRVNELRIDGGLIIAAIYSI
jgi:hypothetical protein